MGGTIMTNSLRIRVAANRALGIALLFVLAEPLSARTITLTAEDCDKMAVLYSVVPKQSWSVLQNPNYIDVGSQMQFRPGMTMLNSRGEPQGRILDGERWTLDRAGRPALKPADFPPGAGGAGPRFSIAIAGPGDEVVIPDLVEFRSR